MSKTLPPLPDHPEPRFMAWSESEKRTILEYGEACYAAAIEAQGMPNWFWPMARRRVFDYIRGAYDLGYNDARNARTIPGDGAHGYKGRDVEADHGGALLHALEALASAPPAPQAEQFCYCDDDISLQIVSGGASPDGLYGRVTLKVEGEFVDYVRTAVVQQEPVYLVKSRVGASVWVQVSKAEYDEAVYFGVKKRVLYTHPAKPLTDEQIAEWWASENGLEDCNMAKLSVFTQVVRAVEARVIKGE